MINDRSVRVGEQIGDARVVAIDRYSVRLQRGTEFDHTETAADHS